MTTMTNPAPGVVAGIDIGSVSVATVLLASDRSVVWRDYRFHDGRVTETLRAVLAAMPVQTLDAFGVVSEKGREFFTAGVEVPEQVALIAGVKQDLPAVRGIISIGAETFGIILLDEQGRYRKSIANSACAAGTGSFLDQQSARLGLSGSEELSALAESYAGEPPRIATRCAVFARTDLAHIQQQGYGLPAIAAGLCRGMAQNIRDTLFTGSALPGPVAVAGGVSRNRRVVRYLAEALGCPLQVLPHSAEAGALGAALLAAAEPRPAAAEPRAVADLVADRHTERSYFYPPLAAGAVAAAAAAPALTYIADGVEVTQYQLLPPGAVRDCFLGIDVGSTSTKAVLVTGDGTVLAGLYARTGGQPVRAVQALTRALDGLEARLGAQFAIRGAATTGAGRKFVQKVVRADFAVDEITAHARAAAQLDPAVDTIIEIGGQDAKFTVLRDGQVTFAVMNYVCAAGTGSFIEEQARRLGVALADYADLAMPARAPLISDRCTVFMERDLNQLLGAGYRREELLAAALHSIRDNYLSKVAHPDKIGSHIAFQGATARNRALVRAFEQKLGRRIYVSQFCHLTGAYGACLKMLDAGGQGESRFRRRLHDEQVAVDEYVCDYCKNHCKIKCTTIDGETLGWGYLCGRDEGDAGFRRREVAGFDPLSHYRRVFAAPESAVAALAHRETSWFAEFQQGGVSAVFRRPGFSLARLRNRIQFNTIELRDELFAAGIVDRRQEPAAPAALPTVGLPAALALHEYLPLWRLFFRQLGFPLVTTADGGSRVAAGKEIAGAEFCAPMLELHGHIRELAQRAAYVFYPQLFENVTGGEKKAYCNYAAYAVPLAGSALGAELAGKLIAPVIDPGADIHDTARAVYVSLPDDLRARVTYNRVEEALVIAWEWFGERQHDLQELFRSQFGAAHPAGVVLMGRPYIVLNPVLNKGIPRLLAGMGVQSFTMDMVPVDEAGLDVAREFLAWNHWHYGRQIIRTAETVAQTPGLFPIYLTAFRCAPDSFVLSYFKAIMDYYRKPYLILQVDEHEAGEGYETRLEAAIETFRHHVPDKRRGPRPALRLVRTMSADRTYLLAGFDALSGKLIEGAFRGAGKQALLIEQTPETVRGGLAINDGQCLPVSIITQGIRHTIAAHGLDPARTAVLSNSDAPVSCNLPQYPVLIRQQLDRMGGKLEQMEISVQNLVPMDASLAWMYEIYLA
ncbi:MAG TPA: acyl-CoA dehydratase activase, partial [bacterium]|nr:acyl-CoA dehydratase activase [bacterium]